MLLGRNSALSRRIQVKQKDKHLIEEAADFVGLSASAFVLENALRAARKELASVETISLANKDAETFLNLITNPPPPNEMMKNAFGKYTVRIVNKN